MVPTHVSISNVTVIIFNNNSDDGGRIANDNGDVARSWVAIGNGGISHSISTQS
jgi:hypothetical protein